MNTPGSSAWRCIRTRSPSNAPPENGELGSIAITPTRLARGAVVCDQRVDERRLARAGIAGDADDVGLSGMREQRLHDGQRIRPSIIEIADQPRGLRDIARENLSIDHAP